MLASKYETSTNNREYSLGYIVSSDRFRFTVSNDGTATGIVEAENLGSPSTSMWYFICAWHDKNANTLNIQVNNGTVDSAAWSAGVLNGTAPFNIGRLGGTTTTYHDGSTDEVVFYKRILTAGERTWLYNGGSGRTYTDLTPITQGWYDNDYKYTGSQPHAVTEVDRGDFSDTFAYDQNGNMTCRTESNITYLQTYNAENRIASIAKLASGDCSTPGNYAAKWDFTYDGDGVRTATLITPYDANGQPETASLSRYYFGGALETTGSAVKKYYSFAGQGIAMKEGTTFKYFLSDHLGSISLVLENDSSTILEQQRYLPFGQPRAMSPAITATDFTYTGQRALADTGLMDYDARFYSPSLGRFIQPDTLVPGASNPQNWNRFSYVSNNPILYNDPTGHCYVSGHWMPDDSSACQWASSNQDSLTGTGNGGFTDSAGGSDPDEALDVDDDEPLGHEYWAANPICADYFWINCTDDEIYDYMSRWQYPGQFFWRPWEDGATYNVFPGQIGGFPLVDFFYPGSGKIYARYSNGTLSNIAYPSHIFYTGRVDRTPVTINGTPYVITHGTGTNDGFHLASFEIGDVSVEVGLQGAWIDAANNAVGTTAFNALDSGLLAYTTVVETWQFITGSQQSP